jgi:U3 small nucleolar RNA-associated protein 3
LGQQFLLTKALLQSTTALNLAMYLLLKSEHSAQEDVDVSLIQSHPVMARLQKANTMIEKLDDRVETKVDGLREQLDNLVKAASLMKSGLEEDDDDEDSENESEDAADDESMDEDSENVITADSSDDGVESENDEADNGAELARKNVLNEARFGLRPREIAANVKKGNRKRRAAVSDLGDDGPEDVSATASKNLATTLNAIEQRSAASKKRAASNMEALDDVEDDNDELRRGLEMMEADLGKESEDEGGDEADDVVDDEVADKNDGGFYAQAKNKSNVRKEFKKSLYQVAPKFPRVEPVVEGERALGNQIMKNRGLVAHKSKLNRNGRVKKREQYRKAIIKRKGTVRDVRTDEGHKYGGEETGIKSNLSRSRKLV